MANYSRKAGEKVEKVMHEYNEGKLISGNGDKVKSRKQAIAVGLSEAREAGAKVPMKKTPTSKSTFSSGSKSSTKSKSLSLARTSKNTRSKK